MRGTLGKAASLETHAGMSVLPPKCVTCTFLDELKNGFLDCAGSLAYASGSQTSKRVAERRRNTQIPLQGIMRCQSKYLEIHHFVHVVLALILPCRRRRHLALDMALGILPPAAPHHATGYLPAAACASGEN